MIINRENLESMTRAFMTAWQKGLEWKPAVDLSFLFTDFPSATASNFYAWMDLTPAFREWLGDRVFNNIRANFFQVINRDFEKSERVAAKHIEDDQYGVYAPIMEMYAAAWQQLKYDLVIEVLTTNPTAYTGKAFFADDHAYGDNTIDNLTTSALSKTAFEAAITAAANWKFSNNKYVRPNWTHLVHGPKNHATAFGIVDAEHISDGSGNLVENPNYKRCIRVEIPDLAGDYDDYWFLVDASKPIKAISRQIRKEAVPMMDNDPVAVARTGNFDWMADGRGAAAPAFPHMIYAGIL